MMGGRSKVATWWPSRCKPFRWFVVDITTTDPTRDFYAVTDDFGNLVRVPS